MLVQSYNEGLLCTVINTAVRGLDSLDYKAKLIVTANCKKPETCWDHVIFMQGVPSSMKNTKTSTFLGQYSIVLGHPTTKIKYSKRAFQKCKKFWWMAGGCLTMRETSSQSHPLLMPSTPCKTHNSSSTHHKNLIKVLKFMYNAKESLV